MSEWVFIRSFTVIVFRFLSHQTMLLKIVIKCMKTHALRTIQCWTGLRGGVPTTWA